MGRVPRDRYHGAGFRRRVGGGKAHRRRHAPLAHRGPARPIRPAPADRYRRDHQPGRAAPGRRRRAATGTHADRAAVEAFAARYARGEPQVVWTTLVADLETPVSAFLKVAGGRPMSFLLESVEGGAVRGRYSIIGLEPDLIWRATARAPRSTARRARGPTASAPAPRRRSRRCAR